MERQGKKKKVAYYERCRSIFKRGKCPWCDSEIYEGDLYCERCGRLIQERVKTTDASFIIFVVCRTCGWTERRLGANGKIEVTLKEIKEPPEVRKKIEEKVDLAPLEKKLEELPFCPNCGEKGQKEPKVFFFQPQLQPGPF